MGTAPVGDDVYGDDPTVNALETLAAEITGKEAALFVASGTMGNQLAIMTHTRMGEEIIAGLHSHVIRHEAGAYARLSGVTATTVDTRDGPISAQDVAHSCREPGNLHEPVTSLLCLENPQSDGTVVPLDHMQAAAEAHARPEGPPGRGAAVQCGGCAGRICPGDRAALRFGDVLPLQGPELPGGVDAVR